MGRLPPLRLLLTFEEVVRQGSMRDAATRLNVTRPAVTQALKALEEHVGVALFDRRTKPARLTPAGEVLARATRNGLGLIGNAVEDIRVVAGLTSSHLTVSCTLGLATYWLMPRLPDFYTGHPDIVVNVQAPPSDLPALTQAPTSRCATGRETGGMVAAQSCLTSVSPLSDDHGSSRR